MCKNRNLHQSAYFLTRDLSFRQDRESRLRQELKPVTKEPAKTFHFQTTIWFPQNWIVEVSEPPSYSITATQSGARGATEENHDQTTASVFDAAVTTSIKNQKLDNRKSEKKLTSCCMIQKNLGWKKVDTILIENDEGGSYDFDAAVADDANSHRMEEGRPWGCQGTSQAPWQRNQPNSSKLQLPKPTKPTANTTGKALTENKLCFKTKELGIDKRASSNNNAKAVEGATTMSQPTKSRYRVTKHVEITNTSMVPGWRWVNFYHRTLAW